MKNIKRGIRRILQEVKAYTNDLFKKTSPADKFVIFAQGRTGSNLLETLINSHPQIASEGEILLRSRYKVLYPISYVRGRSLNYPPNVVYGFRLQPAHLSFHNLPVEDFFSFLDEEKWKIIHLRRENFLRQTLSARIAVQGKKWHYYDSEKNDAKPPLIEVDVPQLLGILATKQKALVEEKALLQHRSHIEIIYERDLLNPEDHQEAANKVFNYLNLPTVEVKTKLQRTPFQDLAKVVSNLQEMEEALKNTEFYRFM